MTVSNIPADLVVDFDVYDPTLAFPVDVFQEKAAELRARGPIVWSPHYGGHWIVTRYDEIFRILRDAETFSSYPNNLVDAGQGKFIPVEIDPPEHTQYRQALQPLFGPARMKDLEPKIRAIVNELIDGFAGKGEAEFVAEFAHALPTRVFLSLMGWPLRGRRAVLGMDRYRPPRYSRCKRRGIGTCEGRSGEQRVRVFRRFRESCAQRW